MSDREYDFLKFYMDQCWHEMRHTEQMRATVSSSIITLATLIAGFIVQQGFQRNTALMAVLLIFLGGFGALMTRKLYERHQNDQERLNHWYEWLKVTLPNTEIFQRRDVADLAHRDKFGVLASIRLNWFWFALHMFISAGGLLLLFIILRK